MMKVDLAGLLTNAARSLRNGEHNPATAFSCEEAAAHIGQLRRGEVTLAEFCELYCLPTHGTGYHLSFPLPRASGDDSALAASMITISGSYKHWTAISAMAQGLHKLNLSPELTASAKALEAALDKILGIEP